MEGPQEADFPKAPCRTRVWNSEEAWARTKEGTQPISSSQSSGHMNVQCGAQGLRD